MQASLDSLPRHATTNSMRAFLILAAILLGHGPGTAAPGEDIEVDVELVLAVDVSRSMTYRELEIQRRGYAAALISGEVIDAIRRGPLGQVAITYVEWAGSGSHRVVMDWTLIRGRADAAAFAARLEANVDATLRRTSISGALDFTAGLFADNGFTGLRQVIDVSGDGPNNNGRPVTEARDDALARGLVINGLPLMTREGMGGVWTLDDLDRYYLDCVIGGPGAFVIPVLNWSDFPKAVRRKLVLELAGRSPPPELLPATLQEPYDCLIGEKIWRNRMDDLN
jgi:hypothetical protein